MLAGANLMGGITPDAPSGEVEQRPRAPSASGRSYVITDGQPCNLQAFMDGILSGLGERLLGAGGRKTSVVVVRRSDIARNKKAATLPCSIWKNPREIHSGYGIYTAVTSSSLWARRAEGAHLLATNTRPIVVFLSRRFC